MTSQYGAYALHAGLARLHALVRIHAPLCNNYCFSTAIINRELASMLRYTYIAALVIKYHRPTYVSAQ
jgi:hypothetical protein